MSAPTRDVAAPAAAPVAEGGLLVNVLGDFDLTSAAPPQQSVQNVTPGAEEGFRKFLMKNNGVLFEDDTLQIGVKSDYKKNLGNIYIVLQNFTCTCVKLRGVGAWWFSWLVLTTYSQNPCGLPGPLHGCQLLMFSVPQTAGLSF